MTIRPAAALPGLAMLCAALAATFTPAPAPASGSPEGALPQPPPEIAAEPSVTGGPDPVTAPDTDDVMAAEPEVEIDLGPVSAAGQRMLDRARGSLLQVRGFYGTNRSEAFHGSAFAVAPDGTFVTNYHVIARAALSPREYRLEYVDDHGAVGKLAILAIDVVHDLALIRADGLAPTPLQLRTTIPPRGDRAYALGYPLHLGLVITEGIANGRLDNEFGAKLHYAGPMNPGMSGGPAVDSRGRVFGINVSVSTRGQLISFLVPAEFVTGLLSSARTPLEPGEARAEVTRQLRSHQAALMAALPARFPTQTSAGYALPAQIAPFVDCTAAVAAPPSSGTLLQSVNCRANAALSVQPGLATGDFQFSHRVLVAQGLDPLRFARQLRELAAGSMWAQGSANHVLPFDCTSDAVNLKRFKARATLCMRSYRNHDGLYDLTLVVVSLNHPQRGFVSRLTLRGMEYGTARDFAGRFLRAMQWTP